MLTNKGIPVRTDASRAFVNNGNGVAATGRIGGSLRGLSIASLVFGILGGVLFWWLPLGMVLSLAGLLLGFSDWSVAGRRSLDRRLSIVAILISVAALILNIVIAALGMQIWTFGGM